MEERRKIVGNRIKRARRLAGYRSQRAFAKALGIHETSVARAETGDDRIGTSVFTAIEAKLHWPDDCIARYLESGDERHLPSGDDDRAAPQRPLTPLELAVKNLYYALLAEGWSRSDALRVMLKVVRVLKQDQATLDDATLVAAIEREPEPIA
jgi:transcriptional regulator with XRE-family HTH domain